MVPAGGYVVINRSCQTTLAEITKMEINVTVHTEQYHRKCASLIDLMQHCYNNIIM